MLDFEGHQRAQFAGFLLFFALLVMFLKTGSLTPEQQMRALPAFGNIRWFGYDAAGIVGLAATGFIAGNRFALATATAAFTLAFWTGTRGALFAVGAGLIACTILFPSFRSVRTWLSALLCCLAGFVVASGLQLLVPIESQGPASLARAGGSGRVELWLATIDSILKRPLFGWGEGQTVIFTPQLFGVSFPQPHNIVLQVLHAWGVVGGLLVIALLIMAAPLFFRARASKAASFQCAALMLAVYSFIDGALFYSQSLALFALCFASAVALGLEPMAAGETPDKSNQRSVRRLPAVRFRR
jgi:O-antigen ligase